MTRQYSLSNEPGISDHYQVAIALDPNTRGGSAYLHSNVNVGDKLKISAPRCHFALDEDQDFSILIAGGIGVTPVWAMAQRLMQLGKKFAFYYGAKSRATAPLFTEIETALKEKDIEFVTYFVDEDKPYIGLNEIFSNAPKGAHFYACGPAPMLDAYVEAGKDFPKGAIHLERFSATESDATSEEFELVLNRSGISCHVPADKSILQVVLEQGIAVPHSCEEGVCGACETNIVEGIGDHRDSILSDAEKEEGKTIMVCCSRAKGNRIVLDL